LSPLFSPLVLLHLALLLFPPLFFSLPLPKLLGTPHQPISRKEESPELGRLNVARLPEPDRVIIRPAQNDLSLDLGQRGLDQQLQKVRLGPACLSGVLNQPSSDLEFLVEAPSAVDLIDRLQEDPLP
jgi:hypothetical protein